MPGFILAKAVKNKIDKSPNIKGLLLYRHGIFTFGKTAEESYKRMIHFVSKAEKFLKKEKKRILKVDNNKSKFQVSEYLKVHGTKNMPEPGNGTQLTYRASAGLHTAYSEGAHIPDIGQCPQITRRTRRLHAGPADYTPAQNR